MAPLVTLIAGWIVLRLAGLLGVRALDGWHPALRGALAMMFTLTGLAHFVGLRDDLIAMVPPALPWPGLLVTVTGVLELAGAAALLHPRTAPKAALALALLLVVMFPANVYAAQAGLVIGGEPAEALVPRALLQLLFLAAALAVALRAPVGGGGAGPHRRETVPSAR